MSTQTQAQVAQYELEIEIKADRERVWQALTGETDAWWLPDFRSLGDSVVTLDPVPGGGLTESCADGRSLLWYTVQMIVPSESMYLVGHTAPDWGGPTLSMLKLELQDRGEGCALLVSDALLGRVSDTQASSLSDGWRQLFGDGLGRYVVSTPTRS